MKLLLCGSLDGRGGLGENGYMYMYGWVPSLFSWNYHETYSAIPEYKVESSKVEKKKKSIIVQLVFCL